MVMIYLPNTISAVSAKTGRGLSELTEAVIAALSANFTEAEITADQSNGKVMSYLNAHAEIHRLEYRDGKTVIRCYLPRHLLHHIQAPDVQVRFLDGVR